MKGSAASNLAFPDPEAQGNHLCEVNMLKPAAGKNRSRASFLCQLKLLRCRNLRWRKRARILAGGQIMRWFGLGFLLQIAIGHLILRKT